jgi:elongation factor P hydroxylase
MGASQVVSRHDRLPENFCSQRLEYVFAQCFADQWHTCLVGGAEEPLYQPAMAAGGLNLLYYRADYFASALHEVAHWCIAGQQRRMQPDFGYWYAPDGRDAGQQRAFEAVEYKPQALEWWFSKACGYCFRVSVDNLESPDGQVHDSGPFRRRIVEQARHWQSAGLPARAGQFFCALAEEFGTRAIPKQLEFSLAELA